MVWRLVAGIVIGMASVIVGAMVYEEYLRQPQRVVFVEPDPTPPPGWQEPWYIDDPSLQ
jgi:hypothetical protein